MRAITTIIGKLIRAGVRIKSQGSSFPGFIVEKLNPSYLKKSLDLLPFGVVIISGTNGKTTTTKIVSALLQSQGLRVFTNPTGSNFIRGVISAIVEKATIRGNLNYDIAVLELDEAYAELFVKQYKPKYSLILNVARDQLDRFGEIDKTASMLNAVTKSTTDLVVLNANDTNVSNLESSAHKSYFDIDKSLKKLFLNDDELHGKNKSRKKNMPAKNSIKSIITNLTLTEDTVCKLLKIKSDVTENAAQIEYSGKKYSFTPALSGVYNLYNATAALALVVQVLNNINFEKNINSKTDANPKENVNFESLLKNLEKIKPAFGRGEKFEIGNKTLELILVKNPAGFRLSLASYPIECDTKIAIAINDNYADSRDISWLWDVDFTSLNAENTDAKNINISTAGTRAWDMALRLAHDKIKVSYVEENIKAALELLLNGKSNDNNNNDNSNKKQTIRVFASYTAMLEIRKALRKWTAIEEAGA
ncbi:MAG: DUF1727 domain-containing protein [Bifidobacteriaceae bacterium]|jgi:UDP-N-acetylmuramyl tripeptide synthase|nr:DUF1727 domain-containing protein [Bifidobacteriaceae bacterium]